MASYLHKYGNRYFGKTSQNFKNRCNSRKLQNNNILNIEKSLRKWRCKAAFSRWLKLRDKIYYLTRGVDTNETIPNSISN